jgi:hypothetical protein
VRNDANPARAQLRPQPYYLSSPKAMICSAPCHKHSFFIRSGGGLATMLFTRRYTDCRNRTVPPPPARAARDPWGHCPRAGPTGYLVL